MVLNYILIGCPWAFSRLKYPKHLVNSTIKSFVDSKADIVKEQLEDLSLKVNTAIQPVFASRKIEQELNVIEAKPPIVNNQCVV